jgi:hypothetical protein
MLISSELFGRRYLPYHQNLTHHIQGVCVLAYLSMHIHLSIDAHATHIRSNFVDVRQVFKKARLAILNMFAKYYVEVQEFLFGVCTLFWPTILRYHYFLQILSKYQNSNHLEKMLVVDDHGSVNLPTIPRSGSERTRHAIRRQRIRRQERIDPTLSAQ